LLYYIHCTMQDISKAWLILNVLSVILYITMGSANSTAIPGGGTEGYHVLKVMKSFKCIYLHE